MKTCWRLVVLSLVMASFIAAPPATLAQYEGGALLDPGNIEPVMALDLPFAYPGRLWVEANISDEGLGYEGSYFTLGSKSHIGQDWLDGRWMLEGQGHVSENGGFFSNLGIERAFTVRAAAAEVTGGFFFDYDDDQVGGFAHTFYQWSVHGSVKTRRWDLVGNGYFPFGSTDFAQGDPTGVECFLGNSIVLQPAIDSALRGFDALLRLKPESLGFLNGSVGVGAYGYESDLIDYFGGVRVTAGAQMLRGVLLNAQLNHDDRFDFTGVVQIALLFGANGRGTEYGLLGRDLEPTIRNDHIVRFRQDLILAIDPDTGMPYNVYHVDNLADAAVADGTRERPFTELKDAEAASGFDDIIFVREGNGTTFGMDEGIVLKDGQLLLGDGVRHLIPIQDGLLFELCNDQDGLLPRITNRFGGPAVTLASRNTVRGFIIDGSQGGMSNGIEGNGAASGGTLMDGTIEDVTILGGPAQNGIFLNDITGDWRIARTSVTTAALDGIFIDNVSGPASTLTFDMVTSSSNGRDGIHIEDFDGSTFTFTETTTNSNARHGIRLQSYLNTLGAGGDFVFDMVTSSTNVGDGISVEDADGDLRVSDSTITGNVANGVHFENFTNSIPGDETLVEDSLITGNGLGGGAGINNNLQGDLLAQSLRITGNTVDGNGIGILSRVGGVGALLDVDIIDNVSVSGSASDGMRFISEAGATQLILVQNTGAALVMDGNGSGAGNGIAFFAGDANGGVISTIDAIVRNVAISNTGTTLGDNGIFGSSQLDGALLLDLADISVATTAGNGMFFDINTNPVLTVNSVVADNMTITGSGADGIRIDTGTDTFFDFALTDSTLTGGATGIDVAAVGSMAADIDNRTRLFVQNTTVSGFTFDGIDVTASGDAHVLGTFDGNTVTGNGPGTDPTALPYFDGMNIVSSDDSVVNVVIMNSALTANSELGLDMTTLDMGTINAILLGNSISGNDTAEDAGAGVTSGLVDMAATNAAMGTYCLSMSNNFFQLPAVVTNAGAVAAFTLELDGVTNGVGQPVIVGTVTMAAFGTVCQPAFDAEAAAFTAAGFPPP